MKVLTWVFLGLLLLGSGDSRHHSRKHRRFSSEVQQPIIVFCADGLSARACGASAGFESILAQSSYTLRARTVEHTRSYEAWQAILKGGFDRGVGEDALHPPLFTYIRTQIPNANLALIHSYYIVRNSVNGHAANYTEYTHPGKEAVNFFEAHLAQSSAPPDLSVIYNQEIDWHGHKYGWDSPEYKAAVETVAADIKRVHALVPNAQIFIVSDHGGNGGGHGYTGRDMRDSAKNIDSPTFRDVPWIHYPDANPRPLCDTIRNDDLAVEIARAMWIRPHPSWRTRVAWLPEDTPCTHEDVAPRTVSHATTLRIQNTIWGAALGILFCMI